MVFNSEVHVCGLLIVVLEVGKAAYFVFWKLYQVSLSCKQAFILSLTKFNRPSTFHGKKKKHELIEQHDTCLLLKSHYSYWNVFYLVKMRNVS